MIETTIRTALKQKWLVLLITGVLGAIGIYSFTKMNIDAYPDISGVQVQITTTFYGRAAEEVEKQVTIPLERILSNVPKVDVIRSRTIFGLSLVQISFEPGVDDYWAREVVNQKLSEVDFPEEASASMASLSTAYGEIYRYEIVSEPPLSEMELRTLNDWVIIPQLRRVKGVAEVTNFGGKGKIYTARIDKEKLLKFRITLDDVIKAIKDNNNSGGGSLLDRGSDSLVIRGLGQFVNYQEIGLVLIKISNGTPVYIRDVATIEIDSVPQTGIFSKDQKPPGVEGIVRMRRGENPSAVLENIATAVKRLNGEGLLPKGVKLVPFYNRTELVNETLHTVAHNTLVGIALVVLTLLVFLGDVKVALIVALTIPLSLLFALILMHLTGIPISLLSVGAIDFGIIVDGAVIVTENIVRHLQERHKDEDVQDTILKSTLQVQKPMFFSMLIVILAYVPLLSLRYIEGLLFKPLAITLCYAFIGALLLALYYVPAISSLAFVKGQVPREVKYFEKLTELYRRGLERCLSHGRLVLGATFLLMLLIFGLVAPKLGTEFLPYMDEGVFWLRANFPEGISLKENSYYSEQIRRIIHQVEEVSFVTSQTGRNDAGTDPFPTNRTEFMVGLKPRDTWKNFQTKQEIERYLHSRLIQEFPTTRLNITQPIIDSVTEDTNGTSADLAVEIVGPDMEVLRSIALKVIKILKSIPGNTNVNIEQEGPQPQLHIALDRQKLANYQLSGRNVNSVINTAIGGQPVSRIYEGERKFDIMIKFKEDQVNTPAKIGLVPIFNDVGEALPLSELSKIRIEDGETLIARANNQRRMTVRTDIRGVAQGTFAQKAQKLFSRKIKLPKRYKVEWRGMFENLSRAENHFAILIPMTILMILFILIWSYKSFLPSLIVILAIPAALIGSLFALYLRGMHLSVSAAVGFTSLFGVASMHAVVMVSYLEQFCQDKSKLQAEIIEAASLRFRPVLMTAVVAFLGLLPASLATGIGSDIQRPIATVIVWGLVTSATITLFVLPVLYYTVMKPKDVALERT